MASEMDRMLIDSMFRNGKRQEMVWEKDLQVELPDSLEFSFGLLLILYLPSQRSTVLSISNDGALRRVKFSQTSVAKICFA